MSEQEQRGDRRMPANGEATEQARRGERLPSRVSAGAVLSSVVLLMTVGLLAPLPELDELGKTVLNMLHAPLFTMLTYLFCGRIGRASTVQDQQKGRQEHATHSATPHVPVKVAVGVVVLLTLFGAGTEWAQTWVGRTADWHDLWADIWGAIAGAGLALTPKRRWLGVGLAAAVLLMVNADAIIRLTDMLLAPLDGPQLASFENYRERTRWRGLQARYERHKEFASEGEWSLRVVLEPGEYPFVSLRRMSANWLDYNWLKFEVRIERPTRLFVCVQDREHLQDYDDLFRREFVLEPGVHHVEIALADVARAPHRGEMQMDDIALLQFQAIRVTDEITFYLDNIRLE